MADQEKTDKYGLTNEESRELERNDRIMFKLMTRSMDKQDVMHTDLLKSLHRQDNVEKTLKRHDSQIKEIKNYQHNCPAMRDWKDDKVVKKRAKRFVKSTEFIVSAVSAIIGAIVAIISYLSF